MGSGAGAGAPDLRAGRLVTAITSGLVVAAITAGLVSWLTPDGNLVVTLVPALVAGLAVFGVEWRRPRRVATSVRR